MKFKLLLVILLILIISTVCGCGQDIDELPLIDPLTQQELIDYYKEDMKYTASYESRSRIDLDTIEKFEVTDKNVKLKAIKAQEVIEAELSKDYYGTINTVSNAQFDFIKSRLDDKVLSKNKVKTISKGSGYYFVDVSYNISPKSTGTFNDNSKYIGIHGVFTVDEYGNNYIDEYYTSYVMSQIQGLMYDRSTRESISNKFNAAVNDITDIQYAISSQESEENLQENIEEEIEEGVESEGTINNDNLQEEANNNPNSSNEGIVLPESIQSISVVGSKDQVDLNKQVNFVRRNPLDVKECNRLAGSSMIQTAIMPNLSLVYNYVLSPGQISGYGLFPQGNFDLAIFDYNRNNMKGTVVLRYVFKEDLKNEDIIHFKAIYPVEMNINHNLDKVEKDIISDTIYNEVSKIIDRADRAIMNNDITALMSGEIFGDIGAAMLYCNKNRINHILSNHSKVLNVIAKRGNKYLVKVDQYSEESIKGTDLVIRYKNEYYVVIEQIDAKFIINDFVCASSQLMGDPDLQQESAYIRSLVALSAGGEVTDKNKKEIEELMNNLYTASTNRSLKGMYDCFNDDIELLTEEHKEYLNSRLRGWLTAEGVHSKSIYEGEVVKWLSGSAKQAEFIAKEKITYVDTKKVKEMLIYYRVSAYKDVWKIDEIKVIESGEQVE